MFRNSKGKQNKQLSDFELAMLERVRWPPSWRAEFGLLQWGAYGLYNDIWMAYCFMIRNSGSHIKPATNDRFTNILVPEVRSIVRNRQIACVLARKSLGWDL